MARIAAVHDYLDNLPEAGKVLSVVTLVRMIERVNDASPSITWNWPYCSIRYLINSSRCSSGHTCQLRTTRFASRYVSRTPSPSLNRNELLKKIRTDLTDKLGFKPEQVHLAGTLVLYNNMLQSLYTSQIVTMGFATLVPNGDIRRIVPLPADCRYRHIPEHAGHKLRPGRHGLAAYSAGYDDYYHRRHWRRSRPTMTQYTTSTALSMRSRPTAATSRPAPVPRQHRPCHLLYHHNFSHRVFHPVPLEFHPNNIFWSVDGPGNYRGPVGFVNPAAAITGT